MTPQRSLIRRRWSRAAQAGAGAVACAACCAVPLWLAGGLSLGGAALSVDRCLDSLLPGIALVLAVAAAVVLARRIRRRCADATNSVGGGCPCPPSGTADAATPASHEQALT